MKGFVTHVGNELHKSLRDHGAALGNRLLWATLVIAVTWVVVTYKPFAA